MITLTRFVNSNLFTRGIIHYDDRPLCHTLELPWLDNARNISCIPTGSYSVCKSLSSKFGDCFRFPSVRDRDGILIHCGNTIKDTRGCILVGLDVNDLGLLHSQHALDRLFLRLPDDFTLIIRNR